MEGNSHCGRGEQAEGTFRRRAGRVSRHGDFPTEYNVTRDERGGERASEPRWGSRVFPKPAPLCRMRGVVLLGVLMIGLAFTLVVATLTKTLTHLNRLANNQEVFVRSFYLGESGITYAQHVARTSFDTWRTLATFSLPNGSDPEGVKRALLAITAPSILYDLEAGGFYVIKKEGEMTFYTIGFPGTSPQHATGRAFFEVSYQEEPTFQVVSRALL